VTLHGIRAIESPAPTFRFRARKQASAQPQPHRPASVDLPVTNAIEARLQPMEILKPYLLLACTAFTIGFIGYWALGRALAPAYTAVEAPIVQGPITTSTPDLPLADGKRI
jgi:hypothetical protein